MLAALSRQKSLSAVQSPWQVPLPISEYTTDRVVLYSYEHQWYPITFCSLVDAISLSRDVWLLGTELFVFPINLDPRGLSYSNWGF